MISTIITFILVLGFLIFVHEFGHFIAAKKNGVAVEEFSIGFPPRLFKWRKKETLYSVNLIPIGGYVKLKGEGGEAPEEEDSFAHKKIWQRAVILSAGIGMNFLSAIVLLSIVLWLGFPFAVDNLQHVSKFAKISQERIQVFQVLPHSPAQKKGIKMGDVILSIDGQKIKTIKELQKYINNKSEQTININILRGDKKINIKDIPVYNIPNTNKKGIGVALTKTAIVRYPFWLAPYEGTKRAFILTGAMYQGLYTILKRIILKIPVEMQIAGPIGIASLTGQFKDLGFSYLLQFIALLSINLAIINLLPFPALDGGHIFFLLIEKIRGKKMTAKLEQIINLAGFAILMLLMLWITYKDILRFILKQ